eukprot:scaffold1630_cov298-Prasinococcus_capsulatus_cf.AAC.5
MLTRSCSVILLLLDHACRTRPRTRTRASATGRRRGTTREQARTIHSAAGASGVGTRPSGAASRDAPALERLAPPSARGWGWQGPSGGARRTERDGGLGDVLVAGGLEEVVEVHQELRRVDGVRVLAALARLVLVGLQSQPRRAHGRSAPAQPSAATIAAGGTGAHLLVAREQAAVLLLEGLHRLHAPTHRDEVRPAVLRVRVRASPRKAQLRAREGAHARRSQASVLAVMAAVVVVVVVCGGGAAIARAWSGELLSEAHGAVAAGGRVQKAQAQAVLSPRKQEHRQPVTPHAPSSASTPTKTARRGPLPPRSTRSPGPSLAPYSQPTRARKFSRPGS